MTRMTAAVLLLLFTLGQAVAGPPEKASGKMALDEVADGLRQFHRERDMEKCISLLERLARTRDPRVAVVMGEWYEKEERVGLPPGLHTCLYIAMQDLLKRYYVPTDQSADEWWKKNEADLRRRAKLLPQ